MNNYDSIVDAILSAYPDTLAIHLYGSWGTPYRRADSDLDVAVLLPHNTAVNVDFMDWVRLNKKGNPMRNILVHRYEEIDLTKVKDMVENHLDEILESGQALFRHGPGAIVFQDVSHHDDNDSLKPG